MCKRARLFKILRARNKTKKCIEISTILRYNKTRGLSQTEVKRTITSIYENLLKKKSKNMYIYPPMPSPVSKIKNKYRWRIIIKCILGNNVITEINDAIDKIKTNASISVDINPNNMN